MPTTVTLSAPRIATSAPVIRDGLDPRWNKARSLLAQGRRVAQEFADEIDRLRGLYLRDKTDNLRRGDSPKSHDATSGPEEGFKAAVARELSISPATAYRYISCVKAIGVCQQIEQAPEGEVIELEAGSYEVTEEVRKKARELRENIATGAVPMTRAMPAVAGMFNVQGGGTGGKAATNHPNNTWAGLQKLRTSLKAKHWRQGKGPWDAAVDEWSALLRQLPDELRAATAAWVQKGMPRNER